jgi:hypothetical protein
VEPQSQNFRALFGPGVVIDRRQNLAAPAPISHPTRPGDISDISRPGQYGLYEVPASTVHRRGGREGQRGGGRARRRRPADLLTFAVACRSPAIPLPSTRPSAKPSTNTSAPSTNTSAPSNPSPAGPSTSTPSYAVRPRRRYVAAIALRSIFYFLLFSPPPLSV